MKVFFGAFLNFLYNDFISHIPAHWLRRGFLRLFNRNISKSAKILMHVRLPGFWNLKIGDRSVINQYCLLDCRRYSVVIDHDVDIGPFTKIWTLEHDPNDENHELKGGDVQIGHHSWVASSVIILPGIRLEPGAVVAAGSLVRNDVRSKEIVGGIPAKVIGTRQNDLKYSLKYTPLFD